MSIGGKVLDVKRGNSAGRSRRDAVAGMMVDMTDDAHDKWMKLCLDLAQRGAGRVSPNPMVGAVLVGTDGTLLGQGWHREYGGPHAERHAIQDADRRYGIDALEHATLYVNLEPCVHHGQTPPCTELILEKRIPRVVVGTSDPFPAVSGRGIRQLRDHGVDVTEGVLERECRRFNEAFIQHVTTGRPLVILKLAQTLDGRIAGPSGRRGWISGEASRFLVHHWRATMDAVMVGTGTALADDPALTVRHVEGRVPLRIVLDRTGRLSADLKLLSDEHTIHTIVFTSETTTLPYEKAFVDRGGRVFRVPEKDGRLALAAVLDLLGSEGGIGGRPLQSVLAEGGADLARSLMQADLVDRFYLFVAPKVFGTGPLGLDGPSRVKDEDPFVEHEWEIVGEDVLFRGYRRSV